jgi:hypothetical protein
MVVREKPYVAAGRNETEEQAHKVDELCKEMVPHLRYIRSPSEAYQAYFYESRRT